MRRMKALWMTDLAITAVLASTAVGGAPMGPPAAILGEGQWSVSGEYAFEQMDMKASGRAVTEIPGEAPFFWTQPSRIDSLKSNMVFGKLAYGLCDNWDLFVRAGASNASDEIVVLPADTSSVEVRDSYDGSFGFAWGVGTRATFCRSGPWSVGGLVQVTWFQPGDSDFTVPDPLVPGETWVGKMNLDYWQTQVSLAAAYQADTVRLWGGPFLQFVRGDMDFSGQAILEEGGGSSGLGWSSDLEETAQIGAHFGADWQIAKQWSLWVEGQITEDSWLVGVSAAFTPEKTFGM